MTIQESKDLNYFSIGELIESLMTYEMTYMTQNKHEYNPIKEHEGFSTLNTRILLE